MAERVFLGWERPALPAAAEELARRYPGGEGAAPGEVLVVLPGARAGRRLTELLLDAADARGRPLSPPRIVTVGALPERLYRPGRPVAGPVLTGRAWAESLRELPPDARDAVFPEAPDPDDREGWQSLARILVRLHREVGREGLDFAAVAERCAAEGRRGEVRRWRALARLQEAARERLAGLGYTDRESARREALEAGRLEAAGEIWLVGVVELPGITRSMLEAVDAEVGAMIHAPDARAEGFDPLGCVRPGYWRERELALPEERLSVCRGPAGQAAAVMAALSGEGEVRAPDEITVGVPDEDVVPYLSRRLEARGVAHRYAGGTPLPETRPYRLLSALAAYLDGRGYRELAALVRHPDVEPLLDPGDPVAVVDRYFEDHLPRGTEAAPVPVSDHGAELERLLASLRAELGLDRFREVRTSGAWMPEVLRVLEAAYAGLPLRSDRARDRRLAEACGRIRDAAEEIHRLPEASDVEVSAPSGIRMLLAEVRDDHVPPEPRRPAVEMLGWLELHLDDAPALVVTGLHDDAVPGSAAGDPFLPDGLRGALGLPDDRSRHGRDAYLLEATLRPREEAHLVLGRRTADGDPLRPSRLLLAASGETLARRVRRLFDESLPAPVVGEDGRANAAEESAFTVPPEPEIVVRDVPDRLRVTDFRGLLEDPYRFALERLLGLEEQHDRSRELGALEFGGLAHRVLDAFGRSDAVHDPDAEAVLGRLEELLDRAVRRRYGSDPLPAVRVQVAQLRVRLRRFASWQAERTAAGWRVVATEVGPAREEGVPFEVDGTPVWLRGRIDRVDRREEGDRWQLLDYKTGERASTPDDRHRAGHERRWVDLQLPLYRHLARHVAERPEVPDALGHPGATLETGYVNLSKSGVELSLAGWSDEELEEAYAAARRAVRRLREGRFRYRSGAGGSFRRDPLAPLFRGEARAEASPDGGGTS